MRAERPTRTVLPLVVRGLVGLGVLIVAGGFYAYMYATRIQPDTRPPDDSPLVVRTITATPVPVSRVWTGYGTARAMNAADIAAQVSARAVERPGSIEPGASVRTGDLIIGLEPDDFEQRVASAERLLDATRADLEGLGVRLRRLGDQVEAAEEELTIQERDLERIESAVARGAGNESDVDQRRAALRRAERTLAALRQELELIPSARLRLEAQLRGQEADLELARRNLERTTIGAPFDGVLQRVDVEAGEMVMAGAMVARLVDMTRVEVPLSLPLSATESVSVGDVVTLRADGPVELTWEGRVERIAPEGDAGTRTLTVFVVVEQGGDGLAPGLLLPGRFVVARVESKDKTARIVVPRRVVDADQIMIAGGDPADGDGERARVRPVRVLQFMDGAFPGVHPTETQWAVIESGVEADERVIVSNLDEIMPGQRVESAGVLARGDSP